MAKWKPTFVVGIDFGMTCTAVAYASSGVDWAERNIQKWPNLRGQHDKYPTRIGYDGRDEPVDWGPCKAPRLRREREFKLYLDPGFRDTFEGAHTHEDAKRYYRDYMRKLFFHTEDFFSSTVPGWETRDVEYTFSIPTTWKDPRLAGQLRSLLAEAGFRESTHRHVVVDKTEAEAAAVYAAKNYQKGDVIMVVDAGGATTDVNLLEVEERFPLTRMRALEKAEGRNIGSVFIDVQANKKIVAELERRGVRSETKLFYLAEEMMERDDFEGWKCEYTGVADMMDLPLQVPGHIGAQVRITRSDLKEIFEQLIMGLIKVITEQISALSRLRPHTQLKYIALSGGLGSSIYVKNRLEMAFCRGLGTFSNIDNLRILTAESPQLAVARGLVMDRAQALKLGHQIYFGKCSRASYGVLCRQPYAEKDHVGEKVFKDKLTGKKYVENQIEWLVKAGQVVDEEQFKKRYKLGITKADELEPIFAHIVMSEAPPDQLPRSRTQGRTIRMCTVSGQFQRQDFLLGAFKSKTSWLHRSKDHHIAEFDLKVLVGSTNLTFEIVSVDGSRTYSQESAGIDVLWEQVAIDASSRPLTDSGIYPVRPAETFTPKQ